MKYTNEVPDAVFVEAAIIRCPEDECAWSMSVPWEQVDAKTGGTDQRAEYVAHFMAQHAGERFVIEPGTVILMRGVLADDSVRSAADDMNAEHRLLEELERAAGHDRFVLLFASSDDPVSIDALSDERMAELGWVRAS